MAILERLKPKTKSNTKITLSKDSRARSRNGKKWSKRGKGSRRKDFTKGKSLRGIIRDNLSPRPQTQILVTQSTKKLKGLSTITL